MEDEFFDCDDTEIFSAATAEVFEDATCDQSKLEVNNSNTVDSEDPTKYGRSTLPVPMFSRSDFSIWSILKQCIGKELSKITMPVVFNEPLSFIERIAEYMEYAPLLEQAATCDDPVQRLEYISAFAISALSSNWERLGKPFNPLLGETYELDRQDLGFKFMGEQVSHHPPVTAFHADGASGYAFHGSIQPKLKFWGKTVEIVPKGSIKLDLYNYNETYSWQNVNFNIHNVIVGQLWVEHCGTMEIVNNKTSMKAVITFKQCGWFSKGLHQVEGFIYDGKRKVRALYGSWVLGMYSCAAEDYDSFVNNPENKKLVSGKDKSETNGKGHKSDEMPKAPLLNYNFNITGQKTIWKVNPRPPNAEQYYHFSMFAMCLNEMHASMQGKLAPTDSRVRPDIRCMEEGKIDMSAEEKNRLEEKQRESRKERKKKNTEWIAKWFTQSKCTKTGKDEWVFNKEYWQRDWSSVPDIF